jgi:DNA polymerase-3 subunit gamma/tau
VLSYAGGDLDDAQVIEALGVVDREAIFRLCDAVLAKEADTVLRLVAEVDARGHDLGDLAGLLVEHFRDLMVAKVVDSPSEALLDRSPGEIESLRQQSDRLSRPDLHRIFSLLVGVAEDVSRSPHARISLEMGLLRLLELEPAQSLGTLLAKLDEVASSGGAPSGSASVPKAEAPAGGESPDSGGESPESGGESPESGGESPESGGESPESGGESPESGGESPESGGVLPESGGVLPESGGVLPESGGVLPDSGGVLPDSGATRPEVPAPARAGSTSDWSGLVERVRVLRPALASVLEHGRPLCFGPDRVEIAYPRNTFYWESAHERDNRDMLERVLAEQFGRPVPFALVAETGDTAVATLAESDERREQERVQQITKGALEHPAVRGAISILGGEVKEVIPLDRSEEPV